jgi:hypothetical protein
MIKRMVFPCVLMMLLGPLSYTEESLQFRGAMRTGIFEAIGLMEAWPEEGPPIAWVATGFGVGYSSARGETLRSGHRHGLAGTDLVVWLEIESTQGLSVTFQATP